MAKTTKQPTNAPGDSRLFLLAVGAIVVIGMAAIAWFAGSGGDDDAAVDDGAAEVESGDDAGADADDAPASDGAQTATVESLGDPLEQVPQGVRISDAATDPEFGSVAPTLVGTDFGGNEIRIEPDGRPKAIYFLTHWCPHCQEELPVVQDLIDAGRQPDGIDVYAVSTAVDSGRGNYPPIEWFDDEGWGPPVMRDDEAVTAFATFGGAGFPYAVYLDGDHQVVARTTGNIDADAMASLWETVAAS